MAEEAKDVEVEITPDDFDGEKQDSKAEPSTAKEETKEETKAETKEETQPEVEAKEESKEKSEEETEAKETETEGEAEKPADETETEKPQKGAEERKAQLNTEIRDLVSQRNKLRDEVTKANAEVYQPATEDELIEGGMTATDAKVESLRQSIEMKNYNDQVADAQLTISSESQRVLDDFSWSNPDNENYKKELAERASELLEANLIYDQNSGQVIGSNVSPYQLYKTLDEASKISSADGQIKGQQDAEKMLANADNSTTKTAATKEKVDDLTALWEDSL